MAVTKRNFRARAQQRRGATLVEFAFAAPVLFMLVFGLIEFSRLVMVQQSVANAAREGCREAVLATTQSTSDIDTKCRNMMADTVANPTNTQTLRVSCASNGTALTSADMAAMTTGTPVTVTVEIDIADVTWVPGNWFGFANNLVLQGEATMERE